jgi:integrase
MRRRPWTFGLADAKALLVRECQKAIDRAAKKTGIARINHHDFRHFFATVCIESGVDIATGPAGSGTRMAVPSRCVPTATCAASTASSSPKVTFAPNP